MKLDTQSRRTDILALLADIIIHFLPEAGTMQTSAGSLFLSRKDCMGYSDHCLSIPMAALIVQGEKRITVGTCDFIIRAGECLVNCVDTPSTTMISGVDGQPILSLGFYLDKKILAGLLSEIDTCPTGASLCQAGTRTMDAPVDFMETLLRLAELLFKPEHIPVLAPLIMKELHYLLLTGKHGDILRKLYGQGTLDNRIINTIAWLKNNVSMPIAIGDLARRANMSVSSLHRHFKAITGFSPLQYHKQLRLYEAQRMMLAENERADMAAMAVGYESITQFNREYKRLFGEPPHRDIRRRKKISTVK